MHTGRGLNMSDFLHWDHDLDLDQILGDYTDKEDFVPDSEDDCYVAPSQTTSGSTSYICPVCKKSLRSISGFRGHTTKQHGLKNVRGMHTFTCFQSLNFKFNAFHKMKAY